MSIYIYIIYVYVYVYIYTHTYTCIYIYIQTYFRVFDWAASHIVWTHIWTCMQMHIFFIYNYMLIMFSSRVWWQRDATFRLNEFENQDIYPSSPETQAAWLAKWDVNEVCLAKKNTCQWSVSPKKNAHNETIIFNFFFLTLLTRCASRFFLRATETSTDSFFTNYKMLVDEDWECFTNKMQTDDRLIVMAGFPYWLEVRDDN